ncbi:MAG: hypothetical protein JWM68_4373 [Verrucomicrobiales bacterium]|nr:hypothetical protein [Verrucomicrobiales bacterium]
MQKLTHTYLSRALFVLVSASLVINAAAQSRKAAIFIENRAGASFNDKISTFEDFLTSRVSEKGFSILSREVAINALNSYTSAGVSVSTQNATGASISAPSGQKTAGVAVAETSAAQIAATSAPTKADQLLTDNTSALRLAQSMGVDYLFVASIASYGTEKKSFTDGNVQTVNLIHNLRVTYKVLEATQGGSLVGDTFKVSKTERFTENNNGSANSDVINDLLDQASTQIADSIGRKAEQNKIASVNAKADFVDFTISCGMQDLAQLPISIPDIVMGKDGLVVTTNRLPIEVLNATIELNGLVVGSTPGTFKGPRGLNKVRISREGFRPWERTINIVANQTLKVALQMNDEGYARWQNNMQFLQTLETEKKLTDAAVKVAEGFAQTLRQSGFKVDIKHVSDIKGDAIAKPQISIFK